MKRKLLANLSRRERQIMDAVYKKGRASAAEVRDLIPDPPSYSAVRALLAILIEKGHLNYRRQGPRYIYSPTIAVSTVRVSALRHVMQTFFDNSAEDVVATLLDISASNLTDEEFENLSKLIENSRKEEK